MSVDVHELRRQKREREKKMGGRNGTQRLQIPGAGPAVLVAPHEAPLAFPVTVAHPDPSGIKLHVIGGLTQLEWMTGSVVAGQPISSYDEKGASLAVEFAAKLLEACHKFSHAQNEPEPEEPAEEGETPSPILTG